MNYFLFGFLLTQTLTTQGSTKKKVADEEWSGEGWRGEGRQGGLPSVACCVAGWLLHIALIGSSSDRKTYVQFPAVG